jgi:CRP-like cAMP-binding protein
LSVQSLEKLSNIELLSELGLSDLKEIEKFCSFKHCVANEQVIDRQSESTDIFFVIRGAVRVANYSITGRVIAFADLSAGSYFGELAALDGQPRSASVMGLSNCLLAVLSQERFLALLEDHPSIALQVMRSLANIIRISTDRIMDLSTVAANNRVQADVLRLAKDHLKGENVAEISPIPIHSDIASRVSTSRETVARVLMDLARKGIIERQKKALMVKDVKQLSDIVEKVRGE